MEIKQRKLIKRELLTLQMQEKQLKEAARSAKPLNLKAALESRIPEKVYSGLESAFCTGFSLVFQQGRKLIELTYQKKALQRSHALRDWKVRTAASRADLHQMHRSARRSDGVNMAATTAEGIALGALGVGMPDIVLFLSTLLKGIYETAIHYGFGYESRQEQYLILRMMEASLKQGRDWLRCNEKVDTLLEETGEIDEETFQNQLKKTASAFAMDMLLLKFIQGMPVVGILGGAANPVYYNKVMKYIQLKYRKRYLMNQL